VNASPEFIKKTFIYKQVLFNYMRSKSAFWSFVISLVIIAICSLILVIEIIPFEGISSLSPPLNLIVELILGVLLYVWAVLFFVICLPGAIVGGVLSIISIFILRKNKKITGIKYAILGLILNIFAILLWCVLLILIFKGALVITP